MSLQHNTCIDCNLTSMLCVIYFALFWCCCRCCCWVYIYLRVFLCDCCNRLSFKCFFFLFILENLSLFLSIGVFFLFWYGFVFFLFYFLFLFSWFVLCFHLVCFLVLVHFNCKNDHACIDQLMQLNLEKNEREKKIKIKSWRANLMGKSFIYR